MPEPSPQHPGIVAAYSSASHRSPTAVFRVNRRPPRPWHPIRQSVAVVLGVPGWACVSGEAACRTVDLIKSLSPGRSWLVRSAATDQCLRGRRLWRRPSIVARLGSRAASILLDTARPTTDQANPRRIGRRTARRSCRHPENRRPARRSGRTRPLSADADVGDSLAVTGMTGSGRGPRAAGADRVTLRVADLAGRLTERDRQLCRRLWEHQVLTSHQLTQLAFNHLDTAEDRLRTLTALGVLDRFRPRRDTGSAPYHYVLGPLGAAVLAAEQGVTVADLGYRRVTALALPTTSGCPRSGCHGFFTALTAFARHHPEIEGPLVVPAAPPRHLGKVGPAARFGRWRDHEHPRVLPEYRSEERFSDLIAASPATTPWPKPPPTGHQLLVWLTSTSREAELHRAILDAATFLPPPRHYPVATR